MLGDFLVVLGQRIEALADGVEDAALVDGGLADFVEDGGHLSGLGALVFEVLADGGEGFGLEFGVFGDELECLGEMTEVGHQFFVAVCLAVDGFADGHQHVGEWGEGVSRAATRAPLERPKHSRRRRPGGLLQPGQWRLVHRPGEP